MISNCITTTGTTTGTIESSQAISTTCTSTSAVWSNYRGGLIDVGELERKLKAAESRAKEIEIDITQIKIRYKDIKAAPTVKRIFKTGERMTVLWEDGTKTIVKRAEDEPASDYAAFTAALGIKVFGTNSEIKRLVATAKEQGRKKNRAERSKDAEHTEGQRD